MSQTMNGKDSAHAPAGGLVGGSATIGVALIDAGERLATKAIEAGAHVAEVWLRSTHALATDAIEKLAETIQQILDASRETAERALEAAGAAVEGAGRFGERTAASVTEAISLAAESRVATPGNGATSARFYHASSSSETSPAATA